MSNQANFENPEDFRVFTEDEKAEIWEHFFGDKWSLNHIADHFEVRKVKIITVIETYTPVVQIIRGKAA